MELHRKILIKLIISSIANASLINILDTSPPNPQVAYMENIHNILCQDCKNNLIIRDSNDRISDLILSTNLQPFSNITTVIIEFNNGVLKSAILGNHISEEAEFTMIFLTKWYINNINEFLLKIKMLPLWNNYSKIIVLITNDDINLDDLRWLQNICRAFWMEKMLRVFVYFWLNNEMHIYMYNPFKREFAINISNATTNQLNVKLEYELLDLFGYPLKVYIYDVTSYKQRFSSKQIDSKGYESYLGLDGKFLTMIRDVLNVSLEITKESQDNIVQEVFIEQKNDSRFLANKLLEKYDFDLWFTALRAKVNNTLENLFLHERDDICFVVPTGAPIPHYLYLLYIIPMQIWLTTFISFVCIVFVLYFASSIKRQIAEIRRIKYQHVNYSILDVYCILLSTPFARLNKQCKNTFDRIIFSMWMIFAVVFSAAFQSTLTTTLILPKFNPNINTISELLKTNFTLFASSYDKSILAQNLDRVNTRLLDRVIEGDILTIEWMLENQGNDGFLVRSEVARQFVSMARDQETGEPRYHIVREHPVPSAQSYQLPRDHPYFEEMLWIVNKVYESGLYFRWRQTNFGWTETLTNISDRQSNMEVTKFEPLSLVHLQSAFCLMFLGLGFGLVTFVTEQIWNKCKSN